MSVIQYPHIGKAYLPGDSVKVGTVWTESGSSLDLETRCRVEPRGESQYITGIDGKHITFSSIVYMPIPAKEIKVGTLFEVWDGEILKVREDVKQFSKGQLNARVWL